MAKADDVEDDQTAELEFPLDRVGFPVCNASLRKFVWPPAAGGGFLKKHEPASHFVSVAILM